MMSDLQRSLPRGWRGAPTVAVWLFLAAVVLFVVFLCGVAPTVVAVVLTGLALGLIVFGFIMVSRKYVGEVRLFGGLVLTVGAVWSLYMSLVSLLLLLHAVLSPYNLLG